MGKINQKKKTPTAPKNAHANFMGGPSYFFSDPIMSLRLAASTCFFGEPQYYHRDEKEMRPSSFMRNKALSNAEVDYLRATLDAIDPQTWRGLDPSSLMEKAIDAALDHDVEATLKEAVRLRQEEHIRTTPQVILVRAAHHKNAKGTGLVRKYAAQIIARADEPAVGLAYHLWRYSSKAIPNSLKKAWKTYLENQNDYSLAKYRMESREVKTVDVVNLVHAKSDSVDKLMKGQLSTADQTWESIISKEGSSKDSWLKALDVMGHMALLRNIRNLIEKKVDPSAFISELVKGAASGKQLPFRYFSAYKAVEKIAQPQVLDAIEQCLMESVDRLPRFSGRVMSLCDNSGSAWSATTSSLGTMAVAEIGNLSAILTGMASDEGYIGIFGDELKTQAVRKRSSVFDQLKSACKIGRGIGQGTENGIWLFWDKAIKNEEHFDKVFIYSDMQAGHGGLYGTDARSYKGYQWMGGQMIDVPKLIKEYRKQVNPNVMVYCCQIAGYQDTIVPEFYDRTFNVAGWGEGLLNFAAKMSDMYNQPKQ